MKKILFLLLFIGRFGFSQTTDTHQTTVLTAAQMQEDFSMYRRMLEETHPGLYRYTSKEEIQDTMDSVESTLNQNKSFFAFYTDLALINSKIKCSHSYIVPVQDFDKYTLNTMKTLPFYLHGIEDKLYVLFNGSLNEEVKPGYEVLSINGKSIAEIRDIIYKIVWSDADIESAKVRFFTGSYFWMSYYLFVDKSDQFDVVFKNLEGDEQQFSFDAQLPRTTLATYKKNPVNKEILKIFKQKKSGPFELNLPKDIEKTAVLSLSGFGGKRINDEDIAQEVTRKFMNKAIKKIKKAKTESLIIDLRYNSGGWDIIGMEILSFLVKSDEPFQYYKEAFAATDGSEFLKYTGYSPSDIAQLKAELIPQEDGTFLLNAEQNVGLRPYQPKENRFEGDIYFLIHEMTGSAASEFAGIAKGKKLGILVGTETNAAYQGGNSFTFIKMPLPNSKIFVNSPLVSAYIGLTPQEVLNRGVLPHYEVNFTRNDLLKRYDRQIEFVKDLIREKKQ